jgi:hypothetical protein
MAGSVVGCPCCWLGGWCRGDLFVGYYKEAQTSLSWDFCEPYLPHGGRKANNKRRRSNFVEVLGEEAELF